MQSTAIFVELGSRVVGFETRFKSDDIPANSDTTISLLMQPATITSTALVSCLIMRHRVAYTVYSGILRTSASRWNDCAATIRLINA